jgi:hypothetical protein
VCGLADLGFTGIDWTFEKRVSGGMFCRARLDMALATPDWCDRYPLAEVKHLSTTSTSDHIPILLSLEPSSAGHRPRPIFRYETMWESHADFKPMLDQVWKAGEARICRASRIS